MTKIEKIIFFFLIIFILLLGITILNKTETNSFSNEKLNFDQFSEGVTQLKNNQDVNFKVGVSTGPFTIDPVNSWDSASNNVIGQVCEGLFGYNLSDYSLPRVNWLAEEYWWENDVTLQVKDVTI